jgi:hypothetical protein
MTGPDPLPVARFVRLIGLSKSQTRKRLQSESKPKDVHELEG